MSEYVYTLKEEVPYNVLAALNGKTSSEKMFKAIKFLDNFPQEDQFEDWIAAIKSGKKIVNPLSPREELKKYYDEHNFYARNTICETIAIIAKEHPDVTDWLDGDKDE